MLDLQDVAQPLDRVLGAGVVNELEAAHQFVSSAKYFRGPPQDVTFLAQPGDVALQSTDVFGNLVKLTGLSLRPLLTQRLSDIKRTALP